MSLSNVITLGIGPGTLPGFVLTGLNTSNIVFTGLAAFAVESGRRTDALDVDKRITALDVERRIETLRIRRDG